jgi:hypothetical protein
VTDFQERCKACERRKAVAEGQCPACANERVRAELTAERDPLAWILSKPELRTEYAGQYVAVRIVDGFAIVAASEDLATLLIDLGDDFSNLYIHQFH